jgi:alpha-1,2-mannosyltransferase
MTRAGRPLPNRIPVPVYQAPALVAAAPLSLLPFPVAAVLFELASIAALILALRLLDVRDWRCTGAMLVSYPVVDGLALGTMNAFLVLGAACAWRWRRRVATSAAAVAAVIIAKLFLWPLAVWMLLMRRWRTATTTIFIAAVMTAVGWAAIGFHGLAGYPRILGDLSTVYQARGISTIAALTAAGVSLTLARTITIVLTAALLLLAWRFAREPDCERVAFGLAVMAALAASPIVWAHYLTLAFIPIAPVSPNFSPLWLAPCLGWLAPTENINGHWTGLLVYMTLEAIVIAALLRYGGARAITGRRARTSFHATIRTPDGQALGG